MITISNHTPVSAADIQNKKIEEAKAEEEKQMNQAEDSKSPKRLTRDTYTPEEEPLCAGLYDKDGKLDPPKSSAQIGRAHV